MFQFEIDEEKSKQSSTSGSNTSTSTALTSAADSENISSIFKVGDRVLVENDKGIIRYIGPVGKYKGDWLGIEWDANSTRGKHNGRVDSVEYFKSIRPNGASLVRPLKVKLLKCLMDALHEKYIFDKSLLEEIKQIEDRLVQIIPSYKDLDVIDLSSSDVSEIGQVSQVSEACSNVKVLYLGKNHLTSLMEIYDLCSKLKYLKRLDISENPLDPPILADILVSPSITSIEHLIAGKLNYSWEDILRAVIPLENLNILQVHYNRITEITCVNKSFLTLKRIDLEGNKISRWSDVLKLSSILLLEYLNISGNFIKEIHFPKSRDETVSESEALMTTDAFSNLIYLNISENAIEDWTSVNELNKLRVLKELRIESNTFLNADTKINNRQTIIAKLEKLEKLEGGAIERKERRDSELDYIKKIQKCDRNAEFHKEHPRYKQIAKKLGFSDDEDKLVDQHPKIVSLKKNMINVKLTTNDASTTTIMKDLLETMPINKLKRLVQTLFKKRTIPKYLKVISSRNPAITFDLENDFFTLSKYSIENGDIIYAFW